MTLTTPPGMSDAELPPLPDSVLPSGIRSRFVEGVNGLRMHVLEAGHETPNRPCVLLLHGFPELAFSWRKILPALAQAGYHVVAPDQRGYGRTTGWDGAYDTDLSAFRMMNLVRDAVGLLFALGYRHAACVIGHDFGSPVAAWCATVRPDIFRSVVLMSAPFGGPPALPFDTARAPASRAAPPVDLHAALAALPRPRKHYQWYYSSREADADMRLAPQGMANFLRAYYHVKSADWPANRPEPLKSWNAESLALLPTYYVMDLNQDMAATVAPDMPDPSQVAACAWLPDADLQVYAQEFARTGFQGGLQWYRCSTSGRFHAEHQLYAGRTIDVPSCFIAGGSDWGIHQKPGEFDAMRERNLTRMIECKIIEGAGHWVQQEQPHVVIDTLLRFLDEATRAVVS